MPRNAPGSRQNVRGNCKYQRLWAREHRRGSLGNALPRASCISRLSPSSRKAQEKGTLTRHRLTSVLHSLALQDSTVEKEPLALLEGRPLDGGDRRRRSPERQPVSWTDHKGSLPQPAAAEGTSARAV